MYSYAGRFCNGLFSFGRYNYGDFFMMGLGLIIVLVIIFFLFKKGTFGVSNNSDSPLETLQKRYVNGEISQEEFLEKKEILKRIK